MTLDVSRQFGLASDVLRTRWRQGVDRDTHVGRTLCSGMSDGHERPAAVMVAWEAFMAVVRVLRKIGRVVLPVATDDQTRSANGGVPQRPAMTSETAKRPQDAGDSSQHGLFVGGEVDGSWTARRRRCLGQRGVCEVALDELDLVSWAGRMRTTRCVRLQYDTPGSARKTRFRNVGRARALIARRLVGERMPGLGP